METPTPSSSAAKNGESNGSTSDESSWARSVSKLSVDALPPDAINLNVEGRKVAGPIQGFGRMWRKRHRVRLSNADVTPEYVIKTWKEHFGDFWPEGNHFYGPITGLQPGEVAVVNLDMPGGAKLSTGVLVLYADDESFTLMTPQGHMFAGWITFSSYEDEGSPIAQAEILMRASDPIFEIGMELVGHRRENRFWEQTLVSLAAHFGVQTRAETHVELVDPHYQWSKIFNVWQNSAIRTGLYQATTPFRRLANMVVKRDDAESDETDSPTRSAS